MIGLAQLPLAAIVGLLVPGDEADVILLKVRSGPVQNGRRTIKSYYNLVHLLNKPMGYESQFR